MPNKNFAGRKVIILTVCATLVVLSAVVGYLLYCHYNPADLNTPANTIEQEHVVVPENSSSTSVMPYPGDYSEEQALACAKKVISLPSAVLAADLLKEAVWKQNTNTYGYETDLIYREKSVQAAFYPAGLGGSDYGLVIYDGKYIIISKKGDRVNDYDYNDICITAFRNANTSSIDLGDYYLNDDFTMINTDYDNAPETLKGDNPGAELKLSGVTMPHVPSSGTRFITTIDGFEVMLSGFYYTLLPNGRWAIYNPKTIDGTATITYDDKTTAKVSTFSNETTHGCGAVLSSMTIGNGLTLDDLMNTGKLSTGDSIYAYKDESRVRDLYDTIYYPDPKTGDKVMYEQFLKDKPYFFWIDGFGSPILYLLSKYQPAAECGKPVIYLYPEKDMNISVKVEPNGGFKFTEPAHNDGWNVWATTQSELTNLSDGASYPYLFWEGKAYKYQTPDNGFVLKRESVAHDMAVLLKRLGLNEKESADFMEFWQTKLEVKPFVYVTFLSQEKFDQLAPLTVTPKPDKIIRVFMDYEPLDQFVLVPPLKIITPERGGFTVVEWGGRLR